MFLRDLYDSLRRRWYFVAAGVLITAAIAGLAYGQAPVKYEASGSVALVPPATAVISGDNPFLYMGGLEQALGVLTVKLNAPEIQRQVSDSFPNTEYTAAREPSTNGPIVRISVTGSSSDETLGALRRVLGAVPENLKALQDSLNLSAGSRMTSLPLSQDDKTTVNSSGRSRILLALTAAGLAATMVITGQLDKILLRRRRPAIPRRAKEPSSDAIPSPRGPGLSGRGGRKDGAGPIGKRSRAAAPMLNGVRSGADTVTESSETGEASGQGREHINATQA